METMVRLAIERMNEELEKLKEQVRQQQMKIDELRNASPVVRSENAVPKVDEFIDTKDVQKILGVCYNTLRQIVQQGLIKPIRINQRRIRYSKISVLDYLESRIIL
jgi:Fe2+ or Zn2+ uptake regulation protein